MKESRSHLSTKQNMVLDYIERDKWSKENNIHLRFLTGTDWHGNRLARFGDAFLCTDIAGEECYFDADDLLYIYIK